MFRKFRGLSLIGKVGLALVLANEIRGVCVVASVLIGFYKATHS